MTLEMIVKGITHNLEFETFEELEKQVKQLMEVNK